MRQSLKVAISLLIAVVLCSGFAILAFSGGLFSWLQASFTRPRAAQAVDATLERAARSVQDYHTANLDRFAAVAEAPYAAAAFATSPAEADLAKLKADLDALRGAVGSLVAVRFLSIDGRLIFFSTFAGDEAERNAGRVIYKKLQDADPSIPAGRLAVPASASVLLDGGGSRQRIIYLVAVKDAFGVVLGSAAFYVGSGDLAGRLFAVGALETAGFSLASAGSSSAVLLGADAAEGAVLFPALAQAAPDPQGVLLLAPSPDGAPARQVRVFARNIDAGHLVAIVALESSFVLSDPMRWFLVAAFGLTVFLIVYLVANLRADPIDVAAQRIKRFQVQLLEGMVEREGPSDWGRWRSEIESRRGDLNRQLLRGAGRVSRKQRPQLDALLEKNWSEILDLMARRAEAAPPPAAVDLSRIESRIDALIRQAQKSASFVVPAQILGAPAAPDSSRPAPATAAARTARAAPAPIEVEELSADEVEDLEPMEEEAAEAPKAEPSLTPASTPVSAATPSAPAADEEEVAELEEVAEAEEVLELEEAAEEAAEAEVPAELEAEEPAELEEVPEAATPAAAPPAAAEAAAVEDAAEVEEAEELEELEAAGEAEEPSPAAPQGPVEDLGELPDAAAEEAAQSEATEPGAAGTPPAVEAEELGQIEELEQVPELTPLAPLPEEQGLELLPSAEEGGAPTLRVGLELPDALERLAASGGDTFVGLRGTGAGPASEAGGGRPKEAGVSAASSPGDGDEVPGEEEVEELEAVDDAEEAAGDRPWSEAEERQELERLQGQSVICTWTIEQLAKVVEESKSAIVIENGVFRIKEEVYAAGGRSPDGRLRQIAEELIRGPGSDAPAPVVPAPAGTGAEGGPSGIGDLISDEESIDLANVVGRDGPAEPVTLEGERPKVMRLKRGGLDYDEFLAAYPRSFSNTTQMRSLVEISRRVSAVSAALLIRGADGWAPDIAIGLAERTLAGLKAGPADPLSQVLLGKRLAVAINRAPAEIRSLRRRFDPEDLRFTRRLLLLPATFRGQEACLLLSFTSEAEISIGTIFAGLQVQ